MPVCTIACVAYDEDLADRVRELLALEPGVTEKQMFGGLAARQTSTRALGHVGNEVRAGTTAEEIALAATRYSGSGWCGSSSIRPSSASSV